MSVITLDHNLRIFDMFAGYGGLGEGITGVPGLTRREMLKMLGNGVVPAQAAYAVHLLLTAAADDLRRSA